MTTGTKADLLSIAVFPLILFGTITLALAIQRWFDGDRWPVFAICALLLVLIWRFMAAIFKLRDRQAIERIISQR